MNRKGNNRWVCLGDWEMYAKYGKRQKDGGGPVHVHAIWISVSLYFLATCSVWIRPVQTARAGSCLDWATAKPSPNFASVVTGESLQLTIITLNTDNTASHHSPSITPVIQETYAPSVVRRNLGGLHFPPWKMFLMCVFGFIFLRNLLKDIKCSENSL